MPTENSNSGPTGGGFEADGATPTQPQSTLAKPPMKRTLTNDPSLANKRPAQATSGLGLTGQQHPAFTGEPVELPSKGLLYPENHPCRSGVIYVRPITTKEEEILATERLQRQGIALDMVLQRCIMTPGIDTMDLLSGDRLMILFYLRAISYGPNYRFETRMKDGSTQMVETNVAKLKIRELPDGFEEPYAVNIDGTVYELIMSRGRHEQETIRARLRSKKGPNAVEVAPTQTLKNLIIAINGDEDKQVIAQAIDTMIAARAHRLRKAIADVQPGPMLEEEVINASTGELETITIQITESFFRPDLE